MSKSFTFNIADHANRLKAELPSTSTLPGVIFLIVTLLGLSLYTSLQFSTKVQMLISDQIAQEDIYAPIDLWYEDVDATAAQHQLMTEMSPHVYDFKQNVVTKFCHQFETIVHHVADYGANQESLRMLKDKVKIPVPLQALIALKEEYARSYMLGNYLPTIAEKLQSGVIEAKKSNANLSQDVLIRSDDKTKMIHRTIGELLDVTAVTQIGLQLLRLQPLIPSAYENALASLTSLLIRPTLVKNESATRQMAAAMEQSINPVFTYIHKGDLIIAKGETTTLEIQNKLQALSSASGGKLPLRQPIGIFILSLIVCLGLFLTRDDAYTKRLQSKDFAVIALLLLIICGAARSLSIVGAQNLDVGQLVILPYVFPMAGFAGLGAILWDRGKIMPFSMLCALFATIIFIDHPSIFLTFLFTNILNASLVFRVQSRYDIVRTLPLLFIGTLIITLASTLLQGILTWNLVPLLLCFTMINAILSVFLLFALSPIMETSLHYTTRFRLMELMNMDQPLLQELMVETPGTYHHSLLVSNMAEAGAKQINANTLLCKVGSLYHDIGKLAHPKYFIENQGADPNRHDPLSPSMSAIILASHVKKGVELARTCHLGDDISNIIQQHHGTSLMRFFFNKAKEMDENPRPEDYSYPGPRPKSREAAIVMMADVVEASTRTLQDPTPARLKSHVDDIVKSLLTSGQLDDSQLTFKDLNTIGDCFVCILTGIYHHRIAYPDGKPETTQAEQEKSTEGNGDAPPLETAAEGK